MSAPLVRVSRVMARSCLVGKGRTSGLAQGLIHQRGRSIDALGLARPRQRGTPSLAHQASLARHGVGKQQGVLLFTPGKTCCSQRRGVYCGRVTAKMEILDNETVLRWLLWFAWWRDFRF